MQRKSGGEGTSRVIGSGVGGESGDWVIGGGIRRKRSEGRGDSGKLNNGHDSQEVTQRQKREVSERKMNVRQRR